MNWEAMGAVGEIVGAVAVVMTLIYLSVQLRQNTKSAELGAIQAFYDSTASLNRDRGMLSKGLLRRGLDDWNELSSDEQAELDAYLCDFASKIHMGFRLYLRGVLDTETYESWEGSLITLQNEPGGGTWWASVKAIWPGDFRDRIDSKSVSNISKFSDLFPWYQRDA